MEGFAEGAILSFLFAWIRQICSDLGINALNTIPRQLHLQIVESLKKDIENKIYLPGDLFPPEIELAVRFGVSRGTLRKAMKTMVDEGILARIPGKGTFIQAEGNRVLPATERSRLIGIVLVQMMDPLGSSIISGAERVARQKGYSLIFCNLDERLETEAEHFERLLNHHVAGVILFPLALPGELELIETLCDADIPIVLIDRQVPGLLATTIMPDHYNGAYQAVKYLLDLGHRRIACVTNSDLASSVAERIRGYDQAMRDAGLLPYAAVPMLSTGSRVDTGSPIIFSLEDERWVEHMLSVKDPPSAVFCINDYVAISVMHLAIARGLRVPEDLAIVGFDNNPFSQLAPVPLTTIAQPTSEVGVKSVEVLLEIIEGIRMGEETIYLPTSLVVRSSTSLVVRSSTSLVVRSSTSASSHP